MSSASPSRRSFLRFSAVGGASALVGAAAALGAQSLLAPAAATEGQPDSTPRTAPVSGTLVTSDGVQLVAALEIFGADGTRHSRVQSDLLGRFDVVLPLGEWTFVFSRGYEYERKLVPVALNDRLRKNLGAVTLRRHIDLAAAGWFAGDLHQHSSHSDGYQAVGAVMLSAVAGGMD
ncbi:MAG: hypothetical protein KDB08_07240 [Microthrixaceae bacterium]|nr:hypothetical protein [Microthrixaceae bacterium]